MKLIYLMLAGILVCGCTNDTLTNASTKSDSSMKSIDSSAIINDTTHLPKDSTNVGVTH